MSKRQPYVRPEPLSPWRKNRQVTIEQHTEQGTDARGHRIAIWEPLAADPLVWASVQPVTTRTAEYAHSLYAQATHRVLIDYRDDITRGMRLLYEGRTLWIGHVTEVMDARTTLELLCSEGDPYGS